MNLKKTLSQNLNKALNDLNFSVKSFDLTPTKNPKFGDFSSNIALILAKQVGKNPLEIAKEIEKNIIIDKNVISGISVTMPGFINFKISPIYYQNIVGQILSEDRRFFVSNIGINKTANVEFVSANPTGPLSVGHGRQAVIGDTIANILKWHGYEVIREYYYNDGGRQMRILAQSVEARYFQELGEDVELSEDFYQGDYIKGIARDIIEKYNKTLKSCDNIFRETAEKAIFEDIRNTLEKLGVIHDVFSNEKKLIDTGAIDETIEELRVKKLIYEDDGATWFKTTALGKEQDRVLIKSTGEPAYRLPDIAYHRDKFKRNFDFIVDIFGADHIDSYPDVVAAVEALGYDVSKMRVLIHQFVTITRHGEKVKMSTRKATYELLESLIDRVGKDVVRYFFIMRGMKTHLNFDMDLAEDQSEKNPVFYLQYAHARICNIIRHGEQKGIMLGSNYDTSLLMHNSEIELMKQLNLFQEMMSSVLKSLEPRNIVSYLQTLAATFHKFYTECHVITDDVKLSQARLALISATRKILAEGLGVLGINAPERM